MFNQYKPPEYIKKEDKEAISLFRLLAEGLKTTAVLKGKLGALVLEAAIATSRCYWQRSFKKPLSNANDRELKLCWKEDELYARLHVDVGEDTELMDTKPLLCVDTVFKTVSKVITNLGSDQLALLRSAPSVAKDEVSELSLSLSEKVPMLRIESPQSLELEEYLYKQIKPALFLGMNKGEYSIEMQFEYDDFSVNAFGGFNSFVVAEQKIKISRNLEEEASYINTIQSFGFTLSQGFLKTKNMSTWKHFLDSLNDLQDQGFVISKRNDFKLDFQNIKEVSVQVEETSHWFNLRMDINYQDQELQLLPIISKLLEEGIDLDLEDEVYFEVSEDSFLALPSEVLKPILKTFYELLDKPNSEGFKLQKFEAKVLDNFNDSFKIKDTTKLKTIKEELSKPFELPKEIEGLQADLRDYQKEGVAWMQFLRRYSFGGILADDMGLGKTIQTLANLQLEKEAGRLNKPSLIIAPTSLLGNWKNEAQKFTPELRVCLYYGSERAKVLDDINKYDILITTYTLANIDSEDLKKQDFYYLILDEAQRIKNAKTAAAKAIKSLNAQYYLALSGTPMENHLGELHSLFDTVMPDFLGSIKTFKALYQNPIEKERNTQVQERLNARIKPFMLRRTKQKVAKELPPKTEIVRSITLHKSQAQLYETIRVSMEKSVRETIKEMGIGASHISILAALLKLRQVCCDPRLLKIEEAQKVQESAKLKTLMDLVIELKEEGRKILIFSQFTSMLDIIEDQMIQTKTTYAKLTGSTRKRQEQIDFFDKGEADVFLISLKAGGVGLNLTTADTVIHYDPWWNPAAQDQATDRAYRIGQYKPVFVYKLIVENSVESKIMKMQDDKKALANAIYEGKELGFSKMNEKDLLSLFE
ncbi:MAG TPA: DEAD/DEAH box helicase [Sulfurimonas sp.]|nr:DEAD/DEAH box helicase [Sulfurimonas sp.]